MEWTNEQSERQVENQERVGTRECGLLLVCKDEKWTKSTDIEDRADPCASCFRRVKTPDWSGMRTECRWGIEDECQQLFQERWLWRKLERYRERKIKWQIPALTSECRNYSYSFPKPSFLVTVARRSDCLMLPIWFFLALSVALGFMSAENSLDLQRSHLVQLSGTDELQCWLPTWPLTYGCPNSRPASLVLASCLVCCCLWPGHDDGTLSPCICFGVGSSKALTPSQVLWVKPSPSLRET